jgi:hypothetical protein
LKKTGVPILYEITEKYWGSTKYVRAAFDLFGTDPYTFEPKEITTENLINSTLTLSELVLDKETLKKVQDYANTARDIYGLYESIEKIIDNIQTEKKEKESKENLDKDQAYDYQQIQWLWG